ncbi:hypothetical protein AAW01_11760 [Aurantiacibacter gangjinensis]|uniref:BD-FAE-like domain-containing protein n=2 Tax=Aurantiacibacter gangjinensis TaxID=502682 RepID=A0A0G9MNN3_9SPHN|nr:hypothetical protein AAW01_11760 [Aurantiacibacter gangjinensis]
MGNRGGGERRDAASRENAPLASLAYGDHARQAVDFYTGPVAAEAPPLVLFVHGGAWSFGERSHVQTKPSHFAGQGYAFASAGYRVLPDVSVEEQASDLAAALSAIRADAPRLGFDPDRIVLMGHSAGAHLAALVATDPAYAGEDMAAISGVVLLDGGGYDVPLRMSAASGPTLYAYRNAFSEDAAQQTRLSPVTHVGGPDAPQWLILHVDGRAETTQQARALGDALQAAGASVEVVPIAGTDHGGMNRNIGTPGDATTASIDAFLSALFE